MGIPIWVHPSERKAQPKGEPTTQPHTITRRSTVRDPRRRNASILRLSTAARQQAENERRERLVNGMQSSGSMWDPALHGDNPVASDGRQHSRQFQLPPGVTWLRRAAAQPAPASSSSLRETAEVAFQTPEEFARTHLTAYFGPQEDTSLIDAVDSDEADDDGMRPLRRQPGRLFRARTLRSPPPPVAAPAPGVDGLGDRERSWSPTSDHWETQLTTIEPEVASVIPDTNAARRPRNLPAPTTSMRETEAPTTFDIINVVESAANGVAAAVARLAGIARPLQTRARAEIARQESILSRIDRANEKLDNLKEHFAWLKGELERLGDGTNDRNEAQVFALRSHALPVLRGIMIDLEATKAEMESLSGMNGNIMQEDVVTDHGPTVTESFDAWRGRHGLGPVTASPFSAAADADGPDPLGEHMALLPALNFDGSRSSHPANASEVQTRHYDQLVTIRIRTTEIDRRILITDRSLKLLMRNYADPPQEWTDRVYNAIAYIRDAREQLRGWDATLSTSMGIFRRYVEREMQSSTIRLAQIARDQRHLEIRIEILEEQEKQLRAAAEEPAESLPTLRSFIPEIIEAHSLGRPADMSEAQIRLHDLLTSVLWNSINPDRRLFLVEQDIKSIVYRHAVFLGGEWRDRANTTLASVIAKRHALLNATQIVRNILDTLPSLDEDSLEREISRAQVLKNEVEEIEAAIKGLDDEERAIRRHAVIARHERASREGVHLD